jgi:hypothetical protein
MVHGAIVVVKKAFRYPNVFFYNRNAFFLQPLMPQSFIPEHFYGKGYKYLSRVFLKDLG